MWCNFNKKYEWTGSNQLARNHSSTEGEVDFVPTGLFRSANGIILNANTHAGYNIIRKVSPNAFDHLLTAEGLVDVGTIKRVRGLHPARIDVH